MTEKELLRQTYIMGATVGRLAFMLPRYSGDWERNIAKKCKNNPMEIHKAYYERLLTDIDKEANGYIEVLFNEVTTDFSDEFENSKLPEHVRVNTFNFGKNNGYLKMEPEEIIKKANEFVSTYKQES